MDVVILLVMARKIQSHTDLCAEEEKKVIHMTWRVLGLEHPKITE